MKKNLTIILLAILYLALSACWHTPPEPISWPEDMRKDYLFEAFEDELAITITEENQGSEPGEMKLLSVETSCYAMSYPESGIRIDFSLEGGERRCDGKIEGVKLIESSDGDGVTIDQKDAEVRLSYWAKYPTSFKQIMAKSDIKGWIDPEGSIKPEVYAEPEILSHPEKWNFEMELSINIEGEEYHIKVLGRDITEPNYF